ncbi:hypothetical protein ACIQI7_22075 [Kitasatospora sp. NPDC092039]|uniref:hypothetical protein n=1 Tax=Kitasatospora sp. NPDC092039 TaxID=3364086 RepID=UPI0038185757
MPSALLLLICDVHGAAVAPWDLNDRTMGTWSPPSPEATKRVADLIAADAALDAAEKARKAAEKERETRRRAPSDDPHYASAPRRRGDQAGGRRPAGA